MGTERDLRAYYEEEARQRLRKPLVGRRVELRSDFISLIRREARRSVVDLGAGPAGDGAAFVKAGIRFVGLDLAHGNGVAAAEAGLTVVQGSIGAPPFRPCSFDAGWSMSMLMHVPEAEVAAAVAAMTSPLKEGAPLLIGLWGGERRDEVDERRIEGQRRLFSLRPHLLNLGLLAACGVVESSAVWEAETDGWEYQVFLLRVER